MYFGPLDHRAWTVQMATRRQSVGRELCNLIVWFVLFSFSFKTFSNFQLILNYRCFIVCSNDLILCTCVHLGMANKVALGSINFLCTKNSFFIFLMLKMCYFVKRLPKISFKNGPP
jgi:hypothetical protein